MSSDEIKEQSAVEGSGGSNQSSRPADRRRSEQHFGPSAGVALVARPGTVGSASVHRPPPGGIKSLSHRAGPPVRRDTVFRRLLAVADLLAAAGGLVAVAALTHSVVPPASAATIPLIVVVAKLAGRYDHDEVVVSKSTLDEVPALLSLAAAYTLIWSFVALLPGVHRHLGGGGVFVLWASTSALLIGGRAVARALARVVAPRERVLIVGNDDAAKRLRNAVTSDPGARIEVAGSLPFRESEIYEELGRVVRELDIDRVFVAPSSGDSDVKLDALRRTVGSAVKVTIVPRLLEVVGSAVEFDVVGGVTILGVRTAGLSRSSGLIKRSADIVVALIGICVLAPLGALIAIAIRLDSPGPVLFRQQRVGRHGRSFEIVKFRSMFENAEAQRPALDDLNESEGNFKLGSDPRVTRIGRLMRRRSIDEWPQLINVLRGEMSLVGPRPLIDSEDRLIEDYHRGRLELAPGMTGPWQVLGPTRPPLSEMVKTDYLYATQWSLWTDVKIILRTLAHAVAGRGE